MQDCRKIDEGSYSVLLRKFAEPRLRNNGVKDNLSLYCRMKVKRVVSFEPFFKILAHPNRWFSSHIHSMSRIRSRHVSFHFLDSDFLCEKLWNNKKKRSHDWKPTVARGPTLSTEKRFGKTRREVEGEKLKEERYRRNVLQNVTKPRFLRF